MVVSIRPPSTREKVPSIYMTRPCPASSSNALSATMMMYKNGNSPSSRTNFFWLDCPCRIHLQYHYPPFLRHRSPPPLLRHHSPSFTFFLPFALLSWRCLTQVATIHLFVCGVRTACIEGDGTLVRLFFCFVARVSCRRNGIITKAAIIRIVIPDSKRGEAVHDGC